MSTFLIISGLCLLTENDDSLIFEILHALTVCAHKGNWNEEVWSKQIDRTLITIMFCVQFFALK